MEMDPYSLLGDASFMDRLKRLGTKEGQFGLLSNPLFGAGMGLLGASRDATINPYEAAMKGLEGSQKQDVAGAERERQQKLREQLAALILAQQQQTPQQPQMPSGWPTAPQGPIAGTPLTPDILQSDAFRNLFRNVR